MKCLILFISLILLLGCNEDDSVSNAQEKLSYEVNGMSIGFVVSKNLYLIKFQETDRQWIKNKGRNFSPIMENYATIEFAGGNQNFAANKTLIQQEYQGKLLDIEPVLIYQDGTKQVCIGKLIVKVKNPIDFDEMFSEYSFTKQEDEFVENQFLINIENITTSELFQLVTNLNTNPNVEFAEPNFIRFDII